MIMKMRKRAKLVMFVVLVSFVGLMVLGWGADVAGRGGRRRPKAKENTLALVDKEEVTSSDYATSYNRLAAQIGEEKWKKLTEEKRKELADAAWEEALGDAVWVQTLDREKVVVGEKELLEVMKASPPQELLQDTAWYVDGEFNYQLYWRMLEDPEVPPQVKRFVEAYKKELKRELERSKVRTDVVNGLRLTSNQINKARHRAGTRVVIDALFIYELPPVDSTVSQTEMQSYYQENIEDFKREKWWELRTVFFSIHPSEEDSMRITERVKDAAAALKSGYEFEQTALDFTQDSSSQVTRLLDELSVSEHQAVSSLDVGQISEPYFYRGGWHIVKVTGKSADSITYREIYFPLEASHSTKKKVLERIEEFRARVGKENLDTLLAEFDLSSRSGPYVRESRQVVIPRFPYNQGVQTFAVESKVGDVSEPFPEFKGIYFVFVTEDILDPKTVPLDSNLNYVRKAVIRKRAEKAQKEYAQELRQKMDKNTEFAQFKGMPHVSLDTLDFGSYFEAEQRYGGELAGACYALEVGEITGPIPCDVGYGFFRCMEREFDPDKEMVTTGIQNEQTLILNALAEEVFPKEGLKDYRRAYNYDIAR